MVPHTLPKINPSKVCFAQNVVLSSGWHIQSRAKRDSQDQNITNSTKDLSEQFGEIARTRKFGKIFVTQALCGMSEQRAKHNRRAGLLGNHPV